MRYLLLASHGRLAEGMLDSLEMILGKQENVWTISAYIDEHVSIQLQINDVLNKLGKEDELIVVTDIFGGSVNNEFMNLLEDNRIHLLAGLNLPLVIELTTCPTSVSTEVMIEHALKNSKSNIHYCNHLIKQAKQNGLEDF